MGPRNNYGKVKNKRFAWKEFRHSIKPYRWPIGISVLLAVGSALSGMFIPKLLGDMTNIAVATFDAGIDWAQISSKAVLVIALFCVAAALNYAQAFILAVVSANT